MKTYHFSCGNSTLGSIGFCACIRAESKQRALELLQELLPEESPVVPLYGAGVERIEYINVYFNSDAVSVDDAEVWDE